MPHAPILTPTLSGARAGSIDSTVGAMREAARRLVATEADTIVLVSPHSPARHKLSESGPVNGCPARWALSGARTRQWTSKMTPCSLPKLLGRPLSEGCGTEAITDGDLDHGAVVPLLFAAEAGWRAPIVVLSLDLGGRSERCAVW